MGGYIYLIILKTSTIFAEQFNKELMAIGFKHLMVDVPYWFLIPCFAEIKSVYTFCPVSSLKFPNNCLPFFHPESSALLGDCRI